MGIAGIMILGSLFFTIIPAGLLLLLSKRIQRHSLADRAARRMLHGLLVTIVALMIAMYALQDWFGIALIIVAPTIVACVAIACLHIWRTPVLWDRHTALTLMILLVAIILIHIWYVQVANPVSIADSLAITLPMISAGLMIALIWQTVSGHNRWLWLGLVVLIATSGIYNFAYNGMLVTWPTWSLWLLDVTSTFLLPVVLIALAGRLAAYLANTPHTIYWRRWVAGVIVAGLLVALLIIRIVDMFLLDGFDDWGPIGLPLLFGSLAIAIALMLMWELERRRIPVSVAYLVVMAAAIYGLFSVLALFNTNPEETTVARAEQIDHAIRNYYADTGQYPADLYSLIPRYLLTIPNPVLYSDHVWCYEGGKGFYRLAYVSSPVWRAPSETFTIQIHDSAGEPRVEPWICDTLLVEYRERWNGNTS